MPLLEKERNFQEFYGDLLEYDVNKICDDPAIKILAMKEHRKIPSQKTWELLNEKFFLIRPEVELKISGIHLYVLDLGFTKFMKNVRHFFADKIDKAIGYENIKEMRNLKTLSIGILNLSSFDFLNEVSDKLENLYLEPTLSTKPNLKPLTTFKNLKLLYLEKQMKNIEIISELKTLKDITLQSISTPNVDFLKMLVNLKSLAIKLGSIKNISSIANNTKLSNLELWRIKGLSDINVLSSLKSLNTLHLEDLPQIKSIPSLSKLKKLKEVSLHNLTGINDFNFLLSIPALKSLRLTQGDKGHNYESINLNELLSIKSLTKAFFGFNSSSLNKECEKLMEKYGIIEI